MQSFAAEKNQTIKAAYNAGEITSNQFIRYCIDANEPHWDELKNAISSLFYSDKERLFKLAIDNKSYVIAKYLMRSMDSSSIYDIHIADGYSDFQIFKKLYMDSFDQDTNILIKLLDHLILHYKEEMNADIECASEFYPKVCMPYDSLKTLENKYLDNFKVDFNLTFFTNLIRGDSDKIAYLITNKKLDLININWKWQGNTDVLYYSNEDPSYFSITPIQGYIINYIEKRCRIKNQTFQTELLNFLTTVASSCTYEEIFRNDGKGRNIFYYLNKVIVAHNKNNIKLIPPLAKAISLFEAKKIRYIKSKFIFFLFGRSDAGSTVPWDMPTEIIRIMADAAVESERIEWQPKVSNGK